MELNSIQKTGTYAEGVDRHNDNYAKINLELQTIRERGENSKGYFETLASLQSSFPSPQDGWQAFVSDSASSTGYYVAKVENGAWEVSAAEAPPIGVDLAGYARTGGSEKTVKDVETEITQLAGTLNGNIDIAWIANKYVNKDTGEIINTIDYSVSKPIKAEIGLLLTLSISGSVAIAAAYYDVNGLYIGNLPTGDYVDYEIQFPSNADTFILTTRTVDIPNIFLIRRFDIDNFPTKIEVEGILDSAGILNKESVIQWIADKYIDKDTGEVLSTVDYSITPPLKAEDGLLLKMSTYGSVTVSAAYYDVNGLYIGNLPTGDYVDYEIQFPSNADTFILTTRTVNIPNTTLVKQFNTKNYTTKLELNAAISPIKGLDPDQGSLQSMINNNRIIRLGAGVWNIDTPLTIPNGTRIEGIRGGTILKLRNSVSVINLNEDSSDIDINNITFEGKMAISPTMMTEGDIKSLAGIGAECGISVNGYAKNVHIKNCEFRNFSKAGIWLHRTHSLYTRTFKVTDNIFINNYIGLYSDVRSEYHTFMGNTYSYNQIGYYVAGGNNFSGVCHFDANSVGCVISGSEGENDSHGSITGSSFNHNLSFSIAVIDINNGFTFAGCHCFDGNILLSNSKGFNYTGGIISAGIDITSANVSYNMFHSNMFFKTYGGGTITGDASKLSLLGNRFIDGSDSSVINNDI